MAQGELSEEDYARLLEYWDGRRIAPFQGENGVSSLWGPWRR